MDDHRKYHIDPERPSPSNHSKQLQTLNVPTYIVENTNGTNKGIDLQLVNLSQIVLQETVRMPQMDQRQRRATRHWSSTSARRNEKI